MLTYGRKHTLSKQRQQPSHSTPSTRQSCRNKRPILSENRSLCATIISLQRMIDTPGRSGLVTRPLLLLKALADHCTALADSSTCSLSRSKSKRSCSNGAHSQVKLLHGQVRLRPEGFPYFISDGIARVICQIRK